MAWPDIRAIKPKTTTTIVISNNKKEKRVH